MQRLLGFFWKKGGFGVGGELCQQAAENKAFAKIFYLVFISNLKAPQCVVVYVCFCKSVLFFFVFFKLKFLPGGFCFCLKKKKH